MVSVTTEATIVNRGRGPEIAGTRITVFDVMDYLREGWHRDRIASLFRLSSRDIQAAIDYIAGTGNRRSVRGSLAGESELRGVVSRATHESNSSRQGWFTCRRVLLCRYTPCLGVLCGWFGAVIVPSAGLATESRFVFRDVAAEFFRIQLQTTRQLKIDGAVDAGGISESTQEMPAVNSRLPCRCRVPRGVRASLTRRIFGSN